MAHTLLDNGHMCILEELDAGTPVHSVIALVVTEKFNEIAYLAASLQGFSFPHTLCAYFSSCPLHINPACAGPAGKYSVVTE